MLQDWMHGRGPRRTRQGRAALGVDRGRVLLMGFADRQNKPAAMGTVNYLMATNAIALCLGMHGIGKPSPLGKAQSSVRILRTRPMPEHTRRLRAPLALAWRLRAL
ncbi:hypothetical protein D0A38_10580 [Xanthomonas campestris pv. incanae]|nr:hypothetical protein D0A38_10580 [Xanthomonas campestris pv. incanae]